jgi:hypothetical protein
MFCHPDLPQSWLRFCPLIIAHDVARSRDHSTAVVGGGSPYDSSIAGIAEAHELPQKLVGHARASALAAIDRQHDCNAVVVADLSQDPSYAEALQQTFGERVIGVHITRHGDGQNAECRPVGRRSMPVYTIGRSYLFDLLLSQFEADKIRLAHSADVQRAFAQLTQLEVEYRDTGLVYSCPSGLHDDLAISIAMVVWAARHPHVEAWSRSLIRRARKPRPKVNWDAWI